MKKVLLIRFSSIGDIVLTTPVIRVLKKQLGCELHVLTKPQYASITENNPNVDLVYTLNGDLKDIISQLRSEEYDFVVDLQKNIRSSRVRKGLGKPSGTFPKYNKEKWLLVNFKINRLPDVHIVDRYFEAVKPLGVTNDGKGLEYYIPGKDKVNPVDIHPELKRKYAAFSIGGRHNTKKMPPEKIAEIIEKLKMPVILLGGEEDKAAGEIIVAASLNLKVWNVCGNYNLNQSASIIQQAGVVLTHDTGLMHIAAAFNKSIVSIWGNTVPAFGMYPYLPGNEKKSVITEVKDLRCRPCSKLGYKKCPKKHFKCMMEQDTDFIANEANRLFFASLKKHHPPRKKRNNKPQ